ncbi:MAG: hypothetical protein RMK62_11625 [Armatimonadota bacterium]|nr:hypothetical protein [Armatimonadota bacterium]
MRQQVPLGLAIVIIILVVLIAGGAVWFLMGRAPKPEGQAPKEFMPRPPYAPPAARQPQ